jgi:N-acetylmuramoyl-L-alanine amidase
MVPPRLARGRSARVTLKSGQGWGIFGLLLIGIALIACASPPRDDGHAFLHPSVTPQAVPPRNSVRAQLVRPTIPVVVTTPRPPPAATQLPRSSLLLSPTPIPPLPPRPTRVPTPGTPVIFLDPGHGGIDSGTIGRTADGTLVEEKTVALAIALRTAEHLRRDGLVVVLSRTDDSLPGAVAADYTEDGTLLTPDGVLADLQRRIDRANASGASVILSIHFNAYEDPSIRGTQTFYDSSRPFGDESQRFAALIQNGVIAALEAAGFTTPDRGVTDDVQLQTESLGALDAGYNHLVLLGPEIPGRLRPSEMPGALTEVMFLSDPPEAEAASDPATQEILATAYTSAIEQYLRDRPN